MEFSAFIKLIKKKAGTIGTLIFIIVILTLGVSLTSRLKYGAESKLLVIQNASSSDPYTLSRSNEYLGNLLSQVVYSGSFYDLVMNSTYNIDKNYFSGDYRHQLKTWQKTVSTKTISDTGIIVIDVYHQNPYQAQQISLAINDVIMNKNFNYQGNGQEVKVNIIDQPLVSNYPVKPNLPQNLALAIVGGFLLSLCYIYLFPEDRYDIKLWNSRKNRLLKKPGVKVKLEDEFPNEKREEEIKYEPKEEKKESDDIIGDINNILR